MPIGSWRTATAAFAHRDFRLFQSARFLTVIGLQVQSVAIGWQVYSITRRPRDLGFVGLAQFLPLILLSLVTGHVADRFDRKRVMATCFVVYILCGIALYVLSSRPGVNIAAIYAVLAVFGTARAFSGPASQSLLPNVVPREQFSNAMAWGSSTMQLATIVGPALGGLLFARFGPRTFLVSALVITFGLALLVSMRVRAGSHRPTGRSRSAEELFAGIRYVFQRKIILGAMSLDLFAVLLGGAVALMPVFARDQLHVGARGLGWLRSAPAVGAMVTAVMLAWRPLAHRAGAVMLVSVAMFGVATITFGLSSNLWLSLGALVLLGAADMVSVFIRQTLVQLATPDAMRGRVSAVNQVFVGASNELGEFESGITADWLGARTAVVVGGIGTCAIVAVWTFWFPQLRRVDRLDERAVEAAG